MYDYNLYKLYIEISQLLIDGFETFNIDLPDETDESQELYIDAYNPEDMCGTDVFIEANPDNPDEVTLETIAPYPLTFGELTIISKAFQLGIEHCRSELNKREISADYRSETMNWLKIFQECLNDVDFQLQPFRKDSK